MKQKLQLIIVGTLVVGSIILIEYSRTTAPDLRPNYEHDARSALGGFIIYNSLSELLGGAEVRVQRHSPYLVLRDTTLRGNTYFFLTEHFHPENLITDNLLAFVERGNTIFLAAAGVHGPLADSLAVVTGRRRIASATARDSTLLLTAPALRREGGYIFRERIGEASFTAFDSLTTAVIGYAGNERPNYVRVSRGDGAFYIHLEPRAFTNFHLVAADGPQYATAALSYLRSQPTIWDASYKPQRTQEGSALRYVHETRPLAWAYYTLLTGGLLFVVFRGRRRQRPIPIMRPPANQSVRFARAVAHLWHEHGQDRQLMERRTTHLRDRLRIALHEPELEISVDHAESVARRLGMPEGEVADLFALVERLHQTRTIKASDLLELDRRLDLLYQHV